jgi:uncharacterized repeat protein (TIGR04052 family)
MRMATTKQGLSVVQQGAWVAAVASALGCSSEPSLDERMAEQGLERQNVQFRAMIGSEPWSCSGTYAMGSPPSEARPNHLRLFVHDVALIRDDGQAVPLILEENIWQGNFADVGRTVGFLDFDDATGNCRFTDPETNTLITGFAPADARYVGLSFEIGVPPELNHLDAGLAPSPLNRPGMWWSWQDGMVTLRAAFDTLSNDSHRPETADDTTHPGGWQLWMAETVIGACTEAPIGQFQCPEEQQPRVVFDAFDASLDVVSLDFGQLLSEVDLARTEFDVEPEGAEPQVTDPTITPYPMPDYASGFFMDRIDGEGAVILKQLGIDWMTLSPPDPSRQVFATRGSR